MIRAANRLSLLLGLALASIPAPLDGQNDWGVKVSDGNITLPVYFNDTGCTGKNLFKATFIPAPGPATNFQPVPWVTPPNVVEVDGGMPIFDVTVNLGSLPPGTHTGVVKLDCAACQAGTCRGTSLATTVTVTVPYPTTFGASPADAQFGGLVNGQPVTGPQLLTNVLGDIKKSSFAALPGAAAVIKTLEDHYLDNNGSDITFIQTVDDINPKNGTLGVKAIEQYGIDPPPGNGMYFTNSLGGEEIAIGVDMSTKGIHEARQNPSAYYVFTIDGKMAVLPKADLVHNLIHEGFHATQGGKYNVPKPSGSGNGAPLEEEQEGYRVGNAAAAALGLPPESTVPGKGYDAGSNTAYVPLFPTLVPVASGPGAAAPSGSAASAPGAAPSGGAPSTGGAPTTGGAAPSGAAPSTGGAAPSGGAPSTGGAAPSGVAPGEVKPAEPSGSGAMAPPPGLGGSFAVSTALNDYPAIRSAPLLAVIQDGGLEFLTGGVSLVPAPGGRVATVAPPRAGRGADDPASFVDGPMIYLESLGGSTGEVFKVHIVNPDPQPLTLEGYVAVEPVQIPPDRRQDIVEEIRRAPGTHTEMNANFYCLEFLRQAPSAGIVYRIAGAAKQERFAPAARALEAARRLQQQGLLDPDSNPESYFHSIRQWAVWTLEQRFDSEKFLDAFLEHARKNFTRAGREWSDEVEAAVRRSAEGRWQDITEVLADS